MAHDDDYGFARWAVLRNKFHPQGSSIRVANYLLQRANMTGYNHEIHAIGPEPGVFGVLSTYDIYSLLRKAEPEVYREYCFELEDAEETQARLDNARGKRY